jgi:alpha-1,2-mannosyltransferase
LIPEERAPARLSAVWKPAAGVVLALGLAEALRTNARNVAGSFREFGLLDLQVYRMGGRALLDGVPLYEQAYPHDGLPFTYTPFSAVLFVPLQLAGWTGGAVLITVASAAALVRVGLLLSREVAAAAGDDPTWRWFSFGLLVTVGLALWPTRSTVEYGQINLVVLWLIVEDAFGWGRRSRFGGCLTGLAAGLKITPLFLVPFFVVTRQYRRTVNALVTLAVTVAIGFVVQPASAWDYWTRWLLDPNRVGGPAYIANQSLNGSLNRLFAGPPPAGLWLAVAGVVGAGGLALAARLGNRALPLDALAVSVLTLLLVSPISWSHHWVLLLVPLAALLGAAARAPTRRAQIAPLAVAGVAAVVGITRVIGLVPSGSELALGPGQQVLASLYVLGGLALLAYLGASAGAARPAADGP